MKRHIGTVGLLVLGACAMHPGEGDGSGDGRFGEDVAKVRSAANARGCFPEALAAEHAVCVCRDFSMVGVLKTERAVADLPASVGVNGYTSAVADVYVDGGWHGDSHVDTVASIDVTGEMRTAGSFSWVGSQVIGGDLSVGGDLSGVGELDVAGAMRIAGDWSGVGHTVGAVGAYEPLPAPCACDGANFFDVEMAVMDARTHNDNISLGDHVGDSDIVLPAGRYYVDSFSQVGSLRIRAEGDVALFIEGDVSLVGEGQFSVAPGAHLDVYVSGSVSSVGNVELGNPDDPTAFRLFIGGYDGVLVNVGSQLFNGYIYAPLASVDWVGDMMVNGGIIAGELSGVGNLVVSYAGPATIGEATCTDQPIEGPPADEPPEEIPPLLE